MTKQPESAWLQTYTGIAFDLTDIQPEMVEPLDIAHALAMQCRYNGHTKGFYSVAEHCCLIHDWFMDQGKVEEALGGLLHDAAEAYIGDVLLPCKRMNMVGRRWREVEAKVDRAICTRLGVAYELLKLSVVKDADRRILLDECAALMGTPPRPWSEKKAKLEPLGVEIECWSPLQGRAAYFNRLALHGLA